jgi:hypothetical protein
MVSSMPDSLRVRSAVFRALVSIVVVMARPSPVSWRSGARWRAGAW